MKDSLRILWLTENYYPNRGGMAQSCDRIVHQLRQRGVWIDLIHFTSGNRARKQSLVQQGRHTQFPVHQDSAHSLNLLWNYLNAPAQQETYTHILVFGGHLPIMAGPIFAAWMKLPLISCLRGNDVDAAVFMPRRRGLLREALEQASAICSVTQDKIQRLQAWLPKIRIYHTPNGIDLTDWRAGASEHQQAQTWRQAQVAPDTWVIGIFGHLKAKKGLDLLIEALDTRGLREKVHLLISGEVDSEEWNQPLLAAGIPYTHIPFMDRYELLAWYPACDWVAIPSHYEGMPNILLEAGALGIPIIASRIDGMKDLIREGIDGWLFHPGELSECRDALRKAIGQQPEERIRMGRNLQQIVRSQYTHEQEAQRYLDIFQQTLISPRNEKRNEIHP